MLESRTNLAWDTLLALDGSRTAGPLHLRLTQALRKAIREGLIPVGSALPPSRQLAADLDCSRWVVTEAYEQLVAEGYLEALVGSGTRVRLRDEDVQRTAPALPLVAPRPRIDLGPGSPDVSAFPRRAWLRTLREVITTIPAPDLDYPRASGGHPRLRTVLAEYLRRVRGARVDAEDLTVTGGILDGITRMGRAVAAAGHRTIAVEDPSWQRLLRGLRTAGLEVTPVPVDSDGMRVTELVETDVYSVLVAPAHQYPSGSVLSPARRAALLAWARHRMGLIFEDDYDAEFRYDRRPVGTLQGIDPAHVVLLGSLSKTLAPGLALGWIVTPRRWTESMRSTEVTTTGPSVLEQLALARFIETGAYDRHLRSIRRRYRDRRDRLVTALKRHLPQCPVSGVAAGIHVILGLPPGINSTQAAQAAAERGILLLDLQACRADPRERAPQGLVIGYGNLRDDLIDDAAAELAAAIRSIAG